MQAIQAVSNNIIFQFTEDTTNYRFINKSAAGIIVSSEDGNQAAIGRWGKTTHVGPLVEVVKPGDFIFIEAGKWTPGFDFEGSRYWKTDENHVVGTSDSPGTTY